MENNNNYINSPLEYSSLTERLTQLQGFRQQFSDFEEFQNRTMSELTSFLQGWNPKHDLRTVVEDVNTILGDVTSVSDIKQLHGKLCSQKIRVDGFEKKVEELETVHSNARRAMATVGANASVKKVNDFLTSLPELHIAQIDSALEKISFFNRLMFHHVSFFQNWKPKYDFRGIADDVKRLLEEPKTENDIPKLQEKLTSVKGKEEDLTKALSGLVEKNAKLRDLPERHGKKPVADKVGRFVSTIPDIGVSQIDNVLRTTIPGLMKEMDAVFQAFENEQDQVGRNKNLANKLMNNIRLYRKYSNKFDCYKICDQGEAKIKKVLKGNGADPSADRATLEKVQKTLDDLMAAFEKEKKEFAELHEEIESSAKRLWYEDYSKLNYLVVSNNYLVDETVEDIRVTFKNSLSQKSNDLLALKVKYEASLFSRKALERYSSDFDKIRSSCVEKKDLDVLKSNLDFYIKELKKKTFKIVGIVLAILAFIILIFTSRVFRIILLVLIGIAVVIFFLNRD